MHRNPNYTKTNFVTQILNEEGIVTFRGRLLDDINFDVIFELDDDNNRDDKKETFYEIKYRGRTQRYRVSYGQVSRGVYMIHMKLDYSCFYEIEEVEVVLYVDEGNIIKAESTYDSYFTSIRKIRTLKKGFHVGLFSTYLQQPYRRPTNGRIDGDAPVIMQVFDPEEMNRVANLLFLQRESFTSLRVDENRYLVRNIYDSDHPSYNTLMDELYLGDVRYRYKSLDIFDFIELYPILSADLYAEDVNATIKFLDSSTVTYRSPIYEDGGFLTGQELTSDWMENSYVLVEIESFINGERIRAIVNSLRAMGSRGSLLATSPVQILEMI